MGPHQDTQPGRSTQPGAGHVHHERRVPAAGCYQEDRPQPVGVTGVDFLGRRHHRRAHDHLDGVSEPWHLCPTSEPDARGNAANRGSGWVAGPGGQPGTPDRPFLNRCGLDIPRSEARKRVRPRRAAGRCGTGPAASGGDAMSRRSITVIPAVGRGRRPMTAPHTAS